MKVQNNMADQTPDSSTNKVAEYWNPAPEAGIQWTEVPAVQQYLNLRATGSPSTSWLDHSATYLAALPKPRRALSIGCGHGIIERVLRQQDICQLIDGVDLAKGAIENAKVLAADLGLEGLNYWVADLHTAQFPAETYDVVYAHAALHHVFQLEYVLSQVHHTLKKDGWFIVFDYVGPSQMQFPKAHLELADLLLRTLPRPLRRFRRWGGFKDEALRLSLREMNEVDPSEGIRSREIVALIASRFEVRYFRNVGGTLLMHVLNEIAGNIPVGDDAISPLIDSMIGVESFLIDSGVIPSYHAYIVCQKTDNAIPVQTLDLGRNIPL